MRVINGHAVLEGDGDRAWGFRAKIVGEDIVLEGPDGESTVTVTYFGGTEAQDPGDNGETECGPRTRNRDGSEAHIDGCSLPVNLHAGSGTVGSPIAFDPPLPCGILVQFYNPRNGVVLIVDRIDNGPAKTGHAADLTRKSSAYLNDGEPDSMQLEVKILGGAKHLPASIRAEMSAAGLSVC